MCTCISLIFQAIISAMDQLKLLGAIEHHDAKTVGGFAKGAASWQN